MTEQYPTITEPLYNDDFFQTKEYNSFVAFESHELMNFGPLYCSNEKFRYTGAIADNERLSISRLIICVPPRKSLERQTQHSKFCTK